MSNLNAGTATLLPETDPVSIAGELFEQTASLSKEGIVDANQLRELADAVDPESVATALLNFHAEDKVDVTFNDDDTLVNIKFPKNVGGTVLRAAREAGELEESMTPVSSDRLLKALHLATLNPSQELEDNTAQPELPLHGMLPRLAIERLLFMEESKKIDKGSSVSASTVVADRLMEHGHSRAAVQQALRRLDEDGIVIIHKNSSGAKAMQSVELVNKDTLTEEARTVAPTSSDVVPVEKVTKNADKIAKENELKRAFAQLLEARNAGFCDGDDGSVNDQIESMIKSELGLADGECANLRKIVRADKSFLTVSFPPEDGGKNRVTKYFGSVDFQDDPLSLMQTMLNDLRSSIQQHKRNVMDRKTTFSEEAKQYTYLAKRLGSVSDWTEHPYSVLDASMGRVLAALGDMTYKNRNC